MARDLTLGASLLASPSQAAMLFNPDGRHPVRQKHLFVVRFIRETQTADSSWRDDLSFVVKSIDRPSVQPVVEELNQYNKKRLIHTGVKYQPINCVMYDTADGAAMNMWIQYARYYFMDYHHEAADYMDDMLNNEISDSTGGMGYGYNIRQGAVNEGINSQNFFTKLVVYQVWGNEYTSYELLNPRITSFTPDDLSYDSGDLNTVQLAISYEGIHHGNTGRPEDLFTAASADALRAMFTDGPYRGDMIEVLGPKRVNNFVSVALPDSFPSPSTGSGVIDTNGTPDQIDRTNSTSEGGSLSRFGTYDWGSVPQNQFANVPNVPTAIGGSQNLTNLLAGNFSGAGARIPNTIVANSAIESAIGETAIQNIPGIVDGMRNAAIATGLSPEDHATRTNGLDLSNVALAGTNQSSDGTSQIGNRANTSITDI